MSPTDAGISIPSKILGSTGDFAPDSAERHTRLLVFIAIACDTLFGAVLGSWSERGLQVVYSAIKTPLFLGGTVLLCLPNFYAVNAVLGLAEDVRRAARGIAAAQATFGIFLVGVAPMLVLVYASGVHYPTATLASGVAFFGATVAGQWTLMRHYRPLFARSRKHWLPFLLWFAMFQFVAIQVAWSLRPFIGDPFNGTTLFRSSSWTNAYVDAARAMSKALAALGN